MKTTTKASFLVLFTILFQANLSAQNTGQNEDADDLYDLKLEELMNIDIVSASKKSENLFEAPFSASVLTKEEIRRAGCTSIMEAFRLMPGLIVREQTNGNFDVHIRGLDNVPPSSVMVNAANTTTLVMIDNRPVYNYLQGGTFWESLPIDLNDIDKIEIVRGPSSAMYGPNAVSGVIHIITRKPEKDGLYTVANVQAGTNSTRIGNASVGFQPNSKFNFSVSGNYQYREREEVRYYRPRRNDYTDNPDSLSKSGGSNYPHPEISMNKYGINTFLNYTPQDQIGVSIQAGLQDSEVQNGYAENLTTSLSTSTSKTNHLDFKGHAYGFLAQLSYMGGTQDPVLGAKGSKYDFTTYDAYLEYELKLKNFSLKPGYNYRRAVYNDTDYWNEDIKEGVISGKRKILTHALSVRTEYKMFKEKLRLFGGVRADLFNNPKKPYFSYQLAGNYSLNDKNLIRVVASRANRSPFIYDTYLDYSLSSKQYLAPSPAFPNGLEITILNNILGNKKIKLVSSEMVELGYRSKIANNFQIDLDVFATQTKNYTELIQGKTNQILVIASTDIIVTNLPMVVHQLGSTLSANWVISKLQLKPFVTVQTTTLRNYSNYFNTPDAEPVGTNSDPQTNNYLNVKDMKHEGTPAVYGGAYLNYQVSSKFNFNINPYYYSSQTFYHRNNIDFRDGVRGVDHISSKLIVNARFSYRPIKHLEIFASGKNILGKNTNEFYHADNIGSNYLMGLNFEL